MPNISSLTLDLKGLLKKDAWFQLSEAFQKIKNKMSEDVCLRYFDNTKEAVLQVDASQLGLVAVLLQDGKQVAYASKALTPAEMWYANTEREMLVVAFGCLKYHYYLYGRRLVCKSDYQPLQKNHVKNYQILYPDCKGYCLKYNHMILESKYIPGKGIALADALSKVHPQHKMEIKRLNFTVHELTPCMTPI